MHKKGDFMALILVEPVITEVLNVVYLLVHTKEITYFEIFQNTHKGWKFSSL